MAIDTTEVRKLPNGYLIKRSYKMNDKMCVYAIRNIKNEKHYIGITSMTMKFRTVAHLCSLRGNRHTNEYLQNAYNKYGEESFEIITLYRDANSLESLQQMEAVYCELYNSHDSDFGYNLGAVGVVNKMSASTKEKMKIVQIERWKDQSLRDEYRFRMNGSVGIKHTEQTKKILSDKANARIKENGDLRNHFKNITPESKERGRLKRIGLLSGNKNPASQPVIAYNPLKQREYMFSTMSECAEYFKIHKSTVERRIKGNVGKSVYRKIKKFIGLNFKRL